MDDDIRWEVCVSKALVQADCLHGQTKVAQGVAEQHASQASQILP